MALLPYGEGAILDIRKLEEYCLSADHPRGRHKARLFCERLGITRSDAVWVRDSVLVAVRDCEAVELGRDQFGVRWRVDVPMERTGRRTLIRTVWIVRTGETFPRFVSCWVL